MQDGIIVKRTKQAVQTVPPFALPTWIRPRVGAGEHGAVLAGGTTLLASIDRPRPGAIYNVTDDEPAAPQTVTEHAAALTGLPLPPAIDFETADLSPMARSFYGENKRVRNRLIRDELGVALAYPTYREGLAALKDQP